MEAKNNSRTIFTTSIGSTLAILQYFTLSKARLLLHSLSKSTQAFYQKQENNLFRTCLPTVFSATIRHERSIRGGEDKFALKVLHVKDNLFMIAYASNELIVKDIVTGEVIDSMQIDMEEPLGDFDIYRGDLKSIIVGFRSDLCFMVNYERKIANQFEHNLPQPLCLVQYLQHFPGKHFMTVSKGGVLRISDSNLQSFEASKFHPSQYLPDFTRPFSLYIELENDNDNSLQYSDEPQTMLAYIIQGKNMNHGVIIQRYFGIASPQNQQRAIAVTGQLIHCLKQLQTRYLAVSLDKELRIFDFLSLESIRTIPTEQPYQFLIRANPRNFNFELGMLGEACIGYAYKTFYECGVSIGPGPKMQEFQFKALRELEEQRKKTVFRIAEKPNAIISQCQYEVRNENYLIVTPREEQDTVIVFRISLQ